MNIAIVDDCRPDCETIDAHVRRFLQRKGEPLPNTRFFESGEAFINAFSPGCFDLVLLDCCMKGMDGLQTARAMRDRDQETALVFITFCQDYAVDGYLVDAAGYLVKPFSEEAFAKTFMAAQRRLPQRRAAITLGDAKSSQRVFVDEIVYCDVNAHYTQLHLEERGVVRVRMPFSALAALLAPYPQFLQCYRGCLINMARTHKAEELNFVMDTGERVPFRKRERSRLLRQYSEYLFKQARRNKK